MSLKKLQKNNSVKKKSQKLQFQILQLKQAYDFIKLIINNFVNFDIIIVFLILKFILIKLSV